MVGSVAELKFSPEAEASYDHIAATDQPRADAIDRCLDQLEEDPTVPAVRTVWVRRDAVYIVEVTVPGRDDVSWVVWGMEGQYVKIHHVGKARP